MRCIDCVKWYVDEYCAKDKIEYQYGSCIRGGPGEIKLRGDAYVDEYITDALDFCSEFKEEQNEIS
jgi:hypothetical protein